MLLNEKTSVEAKQFNIQAFSQTKTSAEAKQVYMLSLKPIYSIDLDLIYFNQFQIKLFFNRNYVHMIQSL